MAKLAMLLVLVAQAGAGDDTGAAAKLLERAYGRAAAYLACTMELGGDADCEGDCQLRQKCCVADPDCDSCDELH